MRLLEVTRVTVAGLNRAIEIFAYPVLHFYDESAGLGWWCLAGVGLRASRAALPIGKSQRVVDVPPQVR